MSTIKERIEQEQSNIDKIYLYKEGIFYKAYERSAYLWVNNICNYEIKKRYVKPYREYVRNNTIIRIKNAVNGLVGADCGKIEHSVNSYLGIMGHCKSYNLRRRIFCSNSIISGNGNFDKSMKTYRIFLA